MYSSSQGWHTATGTQMPCGITECQLPPGRGDIPAFTPARLVVYLATRKGCKAEFTELAGYIPRWYTRPKTVTHPSTNRARRGLTSFMLRTPLTIMPRRQPLSNVSLMLHNFLFLNSHQSFNVARFIAVHAKIGAGTDVHL